MKICFSGFDFPEGKIKYRDARVEELEKKCKAQKVTPFYVEFIKEDFARGDAFIISREHLLDLLILDMEKVEARRDRSTDETEKWLMIKCLGLLEKEIPLCDGAFSAEEQRILKPLAPLSLKPTVLGQDSPEINGAIEKVLHKAGVIFFYTADKKEVHAWPVNEPADIVTCAGKIHSDLARGFIKADVVNYDDFLKVYNMQEARSKGVARVVDRDYFIQPGDIIEIRFNV